MKLTLSMAEFSGPWRWRWLLAEEDTGQPLADHEVDLAGAGDRDAAAELESFLDETGEDEDWAALAAVLRRILGGERASSCLKGSTRWTPPSPGRC